MRDQRSRLYEFVFTHVKGNHMVELSSLWLPILVSGIVLFLASFLAWTVLPHHKNDWRALPNEEIFASNIRELNIPPGNYSFPYCKDGKEMGSPEFQEKQKRGPMGTMQIWKGPPNMGRNMICQFLFFVAVSFCLAYLATLGVSPGATFMEVFRFVGTAGILTYTAATVPSSIWFNWKLAPYVIDGIVYGSITGMIFGFFWPAGPSL
jgi:hypothetical protein